MRAIARLVYTYFTGTPALRAFSAAGVLSILCAALALYCLPQSGLTMWACMAAVASFFIGSSMMPLMLGRMARGRTFGLLPGGRVKLLASAFITAATAALPLPFLFWMASGRPTQAFWAVYASVTLLCGWLYVAMWFITSQRNTTGFLKGLTIIAVIVVAPTQQIRELDAALRRNAAELAITWSVFGACFLLWPRLRILASRLFTRAGRGSGALQRSRVAGHEIDLLLGTANPWVLALAQIVPLLLATRIGFYSASVWLYYLTIFSTVAGAIAGQAAERSRALWLRGDWSREQLFRHVEQSLWRHNSFVLGVLLVLMVAIGSYADLSPILLAVGLPLLILGTLLSTYLGLMITRGLRWQESVLAIVVMLTLMGVAVLAAAATVDLKIVIALEAALALAAAALRYFARARWARLDWMQCRPERALSGRAAA
jgi:hypothetical protein